MKGLPAVAAGAVAGAAAGVIITVAAAVARHHASKRLRADLIELGSFLGATRRG